MAARFSTEQAQAALRELPQWQFDPQRGAIARRFEFDDFSQAWGFMSQLALAAERLGHHPEWANVYQRVDVLFTTHDVNGLSALDIAMAGCAERAYRGCLRTAPALSEA